MNQISVGVILLLVAGVIHACFTRTMKCTRKWAVENTWLVFAVVGLWILPLVVTLLTVPDVDLSYGQVGKRITATAAAFGMGWGISSVLLTLAVEALGIAVAVSVVVGLSAAMGSLVLLALLNPAKLSVPAGMSVIAGAALVVVGAGACVIAEWLRQSSREEESGRASTALGFLFAILSGVGAASLNYALVHGGPLLYASELNGAERLWAPNAVWLPLMIGGSIPHFLYFGYRLLRNGTLPDFVKAGSGSQWALALLMAVLWFGSIELYGATAPKLEVWGMILGWPIFMSGILIAGSLLDVITGEWKGSVKWPLLVQAIGIVVLVAAIVVLAAARQRV